jgi:hypothetical protein
MFEAHGSAASGGRSLFSAGDVLLECSLLLIVLVKEKGIAVVIVVVIKDAFKVVVVGAA